MQINKQNNQSFKSISTLAKPLGQFYNANATLPTLVIETGVTLGRAHEANKRGGMPEAVDRLVEQGISAIVWIYGVKALKSIGDFIGKKFCNIKDLNFDIGFDELRNPLKHIDSKAAKFKAGNILVSTAIATGFIGAILPKINNAILKKTLKKQKNSNENEKASPKMPTFSEFQQKTNKNNLSFTSLNGVENLAHILENNSTARLLITDSGVVAGRFYNAPNKYRKIEGLFRDIASIYFYLKATQDITSILNKLTKNTDIDPKALEKTVEMLYQKIDENPEMTNEEFAKQTSEILNKENMEKLKELFNDKKTISLEKFNEIFPNLKEKASKMSSMQYAKKGEEVLSLRQAKDVLSNSWTSNPEFLKETYDYTTSKNIADKVCYVSSKYLDKTRTSIDNFINQIIENAKKENTKITKEFIEKIAKKNIAKNFAFNTIGTAISIYALGILIPKIQYAITKKMTNENKFHTEES